MKTQKAIDNRLREEVGVTDNSLHNAEVLIRLYGRPEQLDFYADAHKVDFTVVLTWPDGYKFTLTGFAWGYGGTGPTGLDMFLQSLGVTGLNSRNIPLDKFGKTNCSFRFDGKFTA